MIDVYASQGNYEVPFRMARKGDSHGTLEERFWRSVDRNGPVPPAHPELGPCWLWTRSLVRAGYGQIRRAGKDSQSEPAHRIAYELQVGPIPEGHHVHHRCEVTACVRGSHLEALTPGEHLLRGDTFQARNAAKTHCNRGHEFTRENTRYVKVRGKPGKPGRSCKECSRQDWREWYRRTRAKGAAARSAGTNTT